MRCFVLPPPDPPPSVTLGLPEPKIILAGFVQTARGTATTLSARDNRILCQLAASYSGAGIRRREKRFRSAASVFTATALESWTGPTVEK